jgi:hypothetical protein
VAVKAFPQILYAGGPLFSPCRGPPAFCMHQAIKLFTCIRHQAFYMPDAVELICMRPSAYAKGSLSSQSYQIGLQLGVSVISQRRQNCVELVKKFLASLNMFREHQVLLDGGDNWKERYSVNQSTCCSR